jgi:hypothetical protein
MRPFHPLHLIRRMFQFPLIRRMFQFPRIPRMFRFLLIPLILWRQWIRPTRWRTQWVLETPLATGSRWATGTLWGPTAVRGAAT